MNSPVGNCAWLVGSLRPFESVHAITAKLAISNVLKPSKFKDVIVDSSLSSLRRLLGESGSIVKSVVERPPWAAAMDMHVNAGHITKPKRFVQQNSIQFRYCEVCLASFYHSWIHNLVWMDYCFIHHGQPLAAHYRNFPYNIGFEFADFLYQSWLPAFSKLLQGPADFSTMFGTVKKKTVVQAAKELGLLLDPDQFNLSREGVETHQRTVPQFTSGLQRKSAVVGVLTDVVAPSQSMLACGLVSAMRGTTNHWFNKMHQWKLSFQESVIFESSDEVRSFWDHLAFVLMSGEESEERTLLRQLIDRLADGHKGCLCDLESACGKGLYDVKMYQSSGETGYMGFSLRNKSICRRLVTLDLLTRLLRPGFLCSKMYLEREFSHLADADVPFVHPTFGTIDILNSPEWRPYKAPFQLSEKSRASMFSIFRCYLCTLEWALFRLEQPTWPLTSLADAMRKLTSDLNIVVVTASVNESKVAQVFMGPEVAPPPWSELAIREPDHESASASALDYALRVMPRSYSQIMTVLNDGVPPSVPKGLNWPKSGKS